MKSSEEYYNILKHNKYLKYFVAKRNHDLKNCSREELLKVYEKEKEELIGYMEKYENPFMHILHFEPKYFEYFKENDEILIQEKIDGSNTHFNLNEKGAICYGNNYILNKNNHLQGFWYWVQDNINKIPTKYYNLDVYGEWLVPHHCEYPSEAYGQFYVFDVMDNCKYWSQDKVESFAKEVGFKYAPILYKGPFVNWKHVMSFVGQTKLGGLKGEGIVIKNQTKLNRTDGCFYVKIVDVEFQETNNSRTHVKTINMDKVLELENEKILTDSIVTLSRIRKILFKLIDNNEIDSNWYKLDEGYALKIIKPMVYKDCIKEEKDTVAKIGRNFGKLFSQNTLNHIETLRIEYLNM